MRARTMLPLVRNVVFVFLLTIAAIVTAANLGLNVTPLLAGAGVIGLAVGFGAQSLVADLITGLFIIIEDTPFQSAIRSRWKAGIGHRASSKV